MKEEQYLKMLEEAISVYPGPGGPIAWWDSKSGKKLPFTSNSDLSDIVKKVAGDPSMSAEERAKDSLTVPDEEDDFDRSSRPEDRQLWEDSPIQALEDSSDVDEINLTEVESEILSRLIEDMEADESGEFVSESDDDLEDDDISEEDLIDDDSIDLELDDEYFGDEDSIDIDIDDEDLD